jgi:hypothetical protein
MFTLHAKRKIIPHKEWPKHCGFFPNFIKQVWSFSGRVTDVSTDRGLYISDEY